MPPSRPALSFKATPDSTYRVELLPDGRLLLTAPEGKEWDVLGMEVEGDKLRVGVVESGGKFGIVAGS